MISRRIERLRARLDERLLVTNLVNVRYLTGFEASNAALLVEPEGGAALYTDFRYLESAEGVEGVEVHEARRALLADLAGRLEGPPPLQAGGVPSTQGETPRARGPPPVPT